MTTSFDPAFKKFKFDSLGTGNFGTGKAQGTESTFTIYSSKSAICIFKSPNASATSSRFGSVRPSGNNKKKKTQKEEKRNGKEILAQTYDGVSICYILYSSFRITASQDVAMLTGTTYKVQHISAFGVSILPNICVKYHSTIPMESSGSNANRLFALFGPQSLLTIAVHTAAMPFRLNSFSFLFVTIVIIIFDSESQ